MNRPLRIKIFLSLLCICLLCLSACKREGNTRNDAIIQNKLVSEITFQQGQDYFIDVRTPGEWSAGVIENALQIDVNDPDFLDKVYFLDKKKRYLVYCQAGGRSAKACAILQEEGFKNLVNLTEGYETIRQWKK